MKKASVLIILVLALFTSCKKDYDGRANSISATIDGKNESFNSSSFAQLQNGATKKSTLMIYGANSVGDGHKLSVSLKLDHDITVGTYTNNDKGVNAVYIQYRFGPDNYADADASTLKNDTATVVITSVNGNNVQGSFSGNLSVYGPNKVKINGKFNLILR